MLKGEHPISGIPLEAFQTNTSNIRQFESVLRIESIKTGNNVENLTRFPNSNDVFLQKGEIRWATHAAPVPSVAEGA